MFLKLLAYGFLAYAIYLVIRFFTAISRVRPAARPRPKTSGVMVKDETCNTYLPKEDAIREIHQGRECFFCSQACRRKFLESQKPH